MVAEVRPLAENAGGCFPGFNRANRDSGPTRPVGTHTVTIPGKAATLPPLAEGEYNLVVEASREVGGREMLRVPFKWDGKTAVDISAQGKSELGKVRLAIQP